MYFLLEIDLFLLSFLRHVQMLSISFYVRSTLEKEGDWLGIKVTNLHPNYHMLTTVIPF